MRSNRFAHLRKLDEHEVGRPRFQFRNPIMGGYLELIVQSLYDYYEVAVNTVVARQVLFSIPIGGQYTPTGGAAFQKQLFHTNLTQAGQLSAPDKHLTRGLAVHFRGLMTPNDANRFAFNTLLEWTINQKRYLVQQVGKVPGGGGVFASTTQNNVGMVANGWPDARNFLGIMDDAIPGQQIEQQQNFAVVLDPTQVQAGAFTTDTAAANPAGTGIACHVHLEGQLARAVQ